MTASQPIDNPDGKWQNSKTPSGTTPPEREGYSRELHRCNSREFLARWAVALLPAILFCLWFSCSHAEEPSARTFRILPLSAGVVNPAVTDATLASTICSPGWTATVRPNTGYTQKLKQALVADEPDPNPANYELDHIISLQLGGHPTAPGNLWMQHYSGPCGARVKDVLEGKLKRLVCAGKLPLAIAQLEIGVDWVSAYNRYVRKSGEPVLQCGSHPP